MCFLFRETHFWDCQILPIDSLICRTIKDSIMGVSISKTQLWDYQITKKILTCTFEPPCSCPSQPCPSPLTSSADQHTKSDQQISVELWYMEKKVSFFHSFLKLFGFERRRLIRFHFVQPSEQVLHYFGNFWNNGENPSHSSATESVRQVRLVQAGAEFSRMIAGMPLHHTIQ